MMIKKFKVVFMKILPHICRNSAHFKVLRQHFANKSKSNLALSPYPVFEKKTAPLIRAALKKSPPHGPTSPPPASNYRYLQWLLGFGTGVITAGAISYQTDAPEVVDFKKDLAALKSFHSELRHIEANGGVVLSFISASRPIGPNAKANESQEFLLDVELIVKDIDKKNHHLIKTQHPLVIINGGAGRPGSGMDAINLVAQQLRKMGYNIRQIYCDINNGFPDEKKPTADIEVIKMGFNQRQLAVISGKQVYVLPGGFGTNYELFQLLTLRQLKRFDIDITSTGLDFNIESITLVSDANLFNSLKQHIGTQLRIGAISESELMQINLLNKHSNSTLIHQIKQS